jgi:hypothetical protein
VRKSRLLAQEAREKWGTRLLAGECVRRYVVWGVKSIAMQGNRAVLRNRFQIGDVMADARNPAADTLSRPDSGPNPGPNPNEKLVKVFGSEQEPEALVVKGLLDSAGIDSDLTSASLVQDAFPGLGGMILLVREEDAEAARRVIVEGRESATDDDATAEFPAIEEPPQKA